MSDTVLYKEMTSLRTAIGLMNWALSVKWFELQSANVLLTLYRNCNSRSMEVISKIPSNPFCQTISNVPSYWRRTGSIYSIKVLTRLFEGFPTRRSNMTSRHNWRPRWTLFVATVTFRQSAGSRTLDLHANTDWFWHFWHVEQLVWKRQHRVNSHRSRRSKKRKMIHNTGGVSVYIREEYNNNNNNQREKY